MAPMADAQGQTAIGSGQEADSARSDDLSVDPLVGQDSNDALVREQRNDAADVLDQDLLKTWTDWKAEVAQRTGLSFGGDYTAVGFAATSSPGDDTAASGIARFFGTWDLVNCGGANTGGLHFRVEHRHAYTDVPPAAFGVEVGYAGTPEPVFNDDGFRTTVLYWKQNFLDDRAVFRLGFIDVKEYFDLYSLASPWSGFHNLNFSTGTGAMTLLPDGAFGAMLGGYLSDHVYAAVSIVDAGGDPGAVFGGFDTFFGDFDTFKTVEVGYTRGGKEFFIDNAHLSFWQLDASAANGTPSGHGMVASFSKRFADEWLFFLRAGWSDGGAAILARSASVGFGHQREPGGNLLGVGLNWGRPSADTFGTQLNDQWTSEIFYRVQLTENIQITPSAQLLFEPALNPDKSFVALFGLRGRVTF